MFAEELGFTLDLRFPHPKCRDNTDRADVPRDKIKRHLKKAAMEQRKTEVKEKRWQGELLAARWEEDQLNQRGCFAWLKNWDTAPTHTIAGMLELYEQLTPTKVYHARKTQTNHPNDTLCRLCGKTAESIPHVLASCSALAQNKKTIKPGPLRWELKQQFPGYDIRQYNIIIDVLEGWSPEVDETMRELFGAR